jgi:hypothetical protein
MTSENDSNIINEASIKEEVREKNFIVFFSISIDHSVKENIIREEELPLPMDIKNEEETIVASSEEPKEEQQIKTEHVDVPSKSETQPVLDQSVIIEGKRSRKPTLRLEISEQIPLKKELSIPQVN